MIITINNQLEKEFLSFNPFFKYCFTKDKRNLSFKEYEYKFKKMCLSDKLRVEGNWRLFVLKNENKIKEGCYK